MNIEVTKQTAVVREPGVLITDGPSAMDLLATVRYETGCSAMVLRKEQITSRSSACPPDWRGRCCKNL